MKLFSLILLSSIAGFCFPAVVDVGVGAGVRHEHGVDGADGGIRVEARALSNGLPSQVTTVCEDISAIMSTSARDIRDLTPQIQVPGITPAQVKTIANKAVDHIMGAQSKVNKLLGNNGSSPSLPSPDNLIADIVNKIATTLLSCTCLAGDISKGTTSISGTLNIVTPTPTIDYGKIDSLLADLQGICTNPHTADETKGLVNAVSDFVQVKPAF